jgi:hypothetical protein
MIHLTGISHRSVGKWPEEHLQVRILLSNIARILGHSTLELQMTDGRLSRRRRRLRPDLAASSVLAYLGDNSTAQVVLKLMQSDQAEALWHCMMWLERQGLSQSQKGPPPISNGC